MDSSLQTNPAAVCPNCGSHIATSLLACPGCGRLVHAQRLSILANAATTAANSGELSESLTYWREAMELLPPSSRQYSIIREKTAALSKQIDELPRSARAGLSQVTSANPPDPTNALSTSPSSSQNQSGEKSPLKAFSAVAVAAGVFILTKGKLLLAGILKGGTFFSMLLSMGVYWTAFGWKFAAGLIVSIYIHEMGHVAMLRRFGIKASAPMFIPGIGAIVRLKQHLATPAEDARVGLAGPMWGLAAAVGAYLISLAAGWPSWAAIAHVGAWINLFNLLPIWQLDGGRAFNAMSRKQRVTASIVIVLAWVWVQDGLLMLIAIVAIGRSLSPQAPIEPDRRALGQYVFLVAALSAMLKMLVRVDHMALTP